MLFYFLVDNDPSTVRIEATSNPEELIKLNWNLTHCNCKAFKMYQPLSIKNKENR